MSTSGERPRTSLPARLRSFGWVRFYGLTLALFNVLLLIGYLWRGYLEARVCDFAQPWAATRLALDGRLPEAYDPGLFPGLVTRMLGADASALDFPYPPTLVILMVPFALLPYTPAMAAWWAVTGGGYLLALRALAGGRRGYLLAWAFPGLTMNLSYGQNGLLNTALMGAGLFLLATRPGLAGFLLGLLAYKPQLLAGAALALVFGRQGRALLGMGAGITLSLLGSLAWPGIEAWQAYQARVPDLVAMLREGPMHYARMPTVFAWLRGLGVGADPASVAQLLSVGVGVALLGRTWWRPAPSWLQLGAVPLASLLISPYSYEYDLVLLAIPLALASTPGRVEGRGGRTLAALAFLSPILHRWVAGFLGIPMGPLVIGAWALWWMARAGEDAGAPEVATLRDRNLSPEARRGWDARPMPRSRTPG